MIQQVEPQSKHEIEIHQIDSDLEEETGNPTFHVNMYTSMTSSVPDSQISGDIFHALFT